MTKTKQRRVQVFPVIDLEATGRAITEQREKAGMSISEMAREIGLSFNAVYKWERGACAPSIDNIIILSALFQIPIDRIVVRKGEGPS